MASNSRLLLLLLLFTAMVAIAAAQPSVHRIATPLELRRLTQFLESSSSLLNTGIAQSRLLAATGVMLGGIRVLLASVEGASNVRRFHIELVANYVIDFTIGTDGLLRTFTIKPGGMAMATIIVLNGNFNQAVMEQLSEFFPLRQPLEKDH
ncbi:hypothetical protein AXF42_Ash000666 [Apostasia shenzhenica]|uniref:Uncharacterized protein n=1 Tax=Apostasia shenzhenica TaxID=1088818 RepID=A0A2I0AGZ3_9ASPA|nr:hypothetical protein AXF42_Ash000666 [Apostasia shenzhenica]